LRPPVATAGSYPAGLQLLHDGCASADEDADLIIWATEIKLRAEPRAGELLAAMKERGERDPGHGDRKSGSQDATPKLTNLDVTQTQSSRSQKLAAMDDSGVRPE
jgi:hypothetical protein